MVSPNIKWVLERLQSEPHTDIFSDDKGPSISINKLTGKAGVLYEKVRYLVDYKEEHTIRRSAIERILKRRFLTQSIGNGMNDVGLSLLQELVGGGYLVNKKVPEGVAKDIQAITNKYLRLGAGQIPNNKLASIMASEIEHLLYPQKVDDLIAESFFNTVISHIKYTGNITTDELNLQTYIACRRSLLEDDNDRLLYALLTRYIPDLATLTDADIETRGAELTQTFVAAIATTEEKVKSSVSWKIASKLKNHSIYFRVIREIVKKHGSSAETILGDSGMLEKEVRAFLAEKYEQQHKLVSRSGNRSIAYIFLTKILIAVAIEFPYERFFLTAVNYFPLATNILFHPLLLLAMVKTIQRPTAQNTDLIVAGVRTIVQDEKIKPIYIKPQNNNVFLVFTFGLFYILLFAVSFGFIVTVLKSVHFNIVSIALFLFFLTLVSYFGFRIRHNSRKWKLVNDDENIIVLIWNFFTIPIVRTGGWLTRHFSSINVFVFFMDFILETPFKFILGTFDSFIAFLKEKKEDPY